MAKILITGGAGFIGAHLAKKLSINKNNKILVVDMLKKKGGGITYLSPENKFIKGDIKNKDILKKIERWKPEIIYHLAAQSGSEGAYDNPKEDLLTNALGTYLLAKLAKKIKCKKFIYTSTVAVYGNSKKKFFEKSEIKPDSIYGVSKYAGELFLKQLLKNSKVKTFIFRVFNTYGPGENLNNLKKGMVSIFCSYIWRNKPIIVKGSLNRYRNFIYINDCVEILAKALSNPKLNNFEIINLTSQVKITVKELIKKIIKVKNFKTYKVRVLKKTPGDSYGFNSKNYYLKKKFPKIKFTTIEVGLKKYFEWIDKLPQKKLNNYHPYSKKIQ
jgi:UDP-glucose 4-epimerase